MAGVLVVGHKPLRKAVTLLRGIALPISWRIRNIRNGIRRRECGEEASEFILGRIGFNNLSLVQGRQAFIKSLAFVIWLVAS